MNALSRRVVFGLLVLFIGVVGMVGAVANAAARATLDEQTMEARTGAGCISRSGDSC